MKDYVRVYFNLSVLFIMLLGMTKQTGLKWIKEGLPCRVVKGIKYVEIHEAMDWTYKNKPLVYYRALCNIEEHWRELGTNLYEIDDTLDLMDAGQL